MKETKYKIVKTTAEVRTLIANCQATGYASTDMEGPLKYYMESNDFWCNGISFQPGSAWIIPCHHSQNKIPRKRWMKWLGLVGKHVIENPRVVKVSWNMKFEQKWWLHYGYVFRGYCIDGMLAKYCLDEERPHGLKEFTTEHIPHRGGYNKALNIKNGYNEPLDTLAKYNAEDCDLTLQIAISLEQELIRGNFYRLFRNLIMPISWVLAESEYSGVRVDKPYLEKLMKEYEIKIKKADSELRRQRPLLKFESEKRKEESEYFIEELQLEIKEIKKNKPNGGQKDRMLNIRREKIKQIKSGKYQHKNFFDKINFNSPKQLVEFFYTHDAGLKWRVIDKTDSGQPSTAEDTLKKYEKKDKTGFVKALLDYRALEKLDSTYIRGAYNLLDTFDRVHATFHIWGTVTGRLSCVEPNLQNIPRDTTAKDIKTMYIPPKGFVLLEVDYSQAELRMVAELAKDKALIEIFQKNYNVHVATACKMFAKIEDYDKVKAILKDPKHPDWLKWEKQKKKAKSLNFSILYLQGDEATAETLECSVEQARRFKKNWFKQFPQVEQWIKNQIKTAHKKGYVYNIFGRKRRLHDIDSPKAYLVAESERQSVNAPIQGGSGDFGLLSEIIIRRKIRTGEFPVDMVQAYRVHDSIGIYIRPTDIHKIVPQVVKICDNPETDRYFGFKLNHVKMKVSPEVGKNWAELGEYDAWTDYTKLVA